MHQKAQRNVLHVQRAHSEISQALNVERASLVTTRLYFRIGERQDALNVQKVPLLLPEVSRSARNAQQALSRMIQPRLSVSIALPVSMHPKLGGRYHALSVK